MNIYTLLADAAATGAAAAAPAGQGQAAQSSGLESFFSSSLLFPILLIVLLWVLLIRPQRKAQKEQQARISALKKGDKVITNAGFHGTVMHVGDNTITLQIAENVNVQIEKVAVVSVIKKDNV